MTTYLAFLVQQQANQQQNEARESDKLRQSFDSFESRFFQLLGQQRDIFSQFKIKLKDGDQEVEGIELMEGLKSLFKMKFKEILALPYIDYDLCKKKN